MRLAVCTHESYEHFRNHNSCTSPWILPVMYGEVLPPTLHLEKMRGLRNPMDVPTADHKMLAAISYFMRNPNNWSEECNHVHAMDNSSTSVPDIRFRLGVEPIMCVNNPGSVHHYVSIYVSLTPNADFEKNHKLKGYRERKTPTPDYLRAPRDPLVNYSDFHIMP
eukprot:1213043-Amphidinium_carterae.4